MSKREPVIFDQYPLFKYPEHSDKVDIIYAFYYRSQWRLGLLEAKVAGGEDFRSAVEQIQKYLWQFAFLSDDRLQGLQQVAKQKCDIALGEDSSIAMVDILAPDSWWEKNLVAARHHSPKGCRQIPLRFLRVSDDFIPRSGGPCDIDISKLF